MLKQHDAQRAMAGTNPYYPLIPNGLDSEKFTRYILHKPRREIIADFSYLDKLQLSTPLRRLLLHTDIASKGTT